MDEEERKRQAAAAAFQQTAQLQASNPAYEDPQQAVADNRARGWSNGRTAGAASYAGFQDEAGRAYGNATSQRQSDSIKASWPDADAVWRQQYAAEHFAQPGASDAFRLLDEQAPGPLEYDPATAAGLPQDTQDEFRRNWDDNLSAAKRAVEAANGPSKEDRDALAIYTDHLVQMADDYQAQKQRAPQTAQTAPVQQAGMARTMSAPAQQRFVPLVTDDDYLAAAKRSQAEKYGEDPFDFL